jgi:protein SCO1/2
MRRIRLVAWGLVAFLALFAGAMTLQAYLLPERARPGLAAMPALGGAFTMRDQHGVRVSEADLRGRPSLLFFGFTSCPDICPTTLDAVAGWLQALGPVGERLQVFFVTVDPERDDAATLKAYVESFDPRIRALIGTEAELSAMTAKWRVVYRRVDLSGGGYTMDHTASLYLVDREGRFAGTISPQEDQAAALAKLRRLLDAGSG